MSFEHPTYRPTQEFHFTLTAHYGEVQAGGRRTEKGEAKVKREMSVLITKANNATIEFQRTKDPLVLLEARVGMSEFWDLHGDKIDVSFIQTFWSLLVQEQRGASGALRFALSLNRQILNKEARVRLLEMLIAVLKVYGPQTTLKQLQVELASLN